MKDVVSWLQPMKPAWTAAQYYAAGYYNQLLTLGFNVELRDKSGKGISFCSCLQNYKVGTVSLKEDTRTCNQVIGSNVSVQQPPDPWNLGVLHCSRSNVKMFKTLRFGPFFREK